MSQQPPAAGGDADEWSIPSIFGRAMVGGAHLNANDQPGEPIGELSGLAADWPLEQWRAEAAAIEAAEDEALGRTRARSIFAPTASPARAAPTAPPAPPPAVPTPPWPEPARPGPAYPVPPYPDAAPPPAPQWSSTTFIGPSRLLPEAPPPPITVEREGTAGTARGVINSSRTMAIASLASRITGFVRSVVLVGALGTGLVADAYNGANSFPNSVYELLLGGVLSSVLIPLLVHAGEHDADRGNAYAQRLLSIATAVLAVTTLVAVALAPYIADVFVEAGTQRTLASTFATLLLPEIFFYGLGAMFVAVLNTRHVYGPGAWAPVANNVVVLVTVAHLPRRSRARRRRRPPP